MLGRHIGAKFNTWKDRSTLIKSLVEIEGESEQDFAVSSTQLLVPDADCSDWAAVMNTIKRMKSSEERRHIVELVGKLPISKLDRYKLITFMGTLSQVEANEDRTEREEREDIAIKIRDLVGDNAEFLKEIIIEEDFFYKRGIIDVIAGIKYSHRANTIQFVKDLGINAQKGKFWPSIIKVASKIAIERQTTIGSWIQECGPNYHLQALLLAAERVSDKAEWDTLREQSHTLLKKNIYPTSSLLAEIISRVPRDKRNQFVRELKNLGEFVQDLTKTDPNYHSLAKIISNISDPETWGTLTKKVRDIIKTRMDSSEVSLNNIKDLLEHLSKISTDQWDTIFIQTDTFLASLTRNSSWFSYKGKYGDSGVNKTFKYAFNYLVNIIANNRRQEIVDMLAPHLEKLFDIRLIDSSRLMCFFFDEQVNSYGNEVLKNQEHAFFLALNCFERINKKYQTADNFINLLYEISNTPVLEREKTIEYTTPFIEQASDTKSAATVMSIIRKIKIKDNKQAFVNTLQLARSSSLIYDSKYPLLQRLVKISDANTYLASCKMGDILLIDAIQTVFLYRESRALEITPEMNSNYEDEYDYLLRSLAEESKAAVQRQNSRTCIIQ